MDRWECLSSQSCNALRIGSRLQIIGVRMPHSARLAIQKLSMIATWFIRAIWASRSTRKPIASVSTQAMLGSMVLRMVS